MNKDDFEKLCFIITPIGNENDPIRRHIDGILDTVIEPLLKSKQYKMLVAHRISTPGSINKQVISGIYNADLVIANLTNLNPNVMYELAFSHSIGKSTITIAESGTTKLPFDITTERTIFYKNDFMGVIELNNQLENVINIIEQNPNSDEIDNPIYTWLDKSIYENKLVKAMEKKESELELDGNQLFEYIISRLDSLEYSIANVSNTKQSERPIKRIHFNFSDEIKLLDTTKKINMIYNLRSRFINEPVNIQSGIKT
ncbi:hypothetical protein L0P85_07020 [Terrisporobacter glycolicus]|nr:hypothetical protein L0P85_07020 [Terrisporobacter glycolicus]